MLSTFRDSKTLTDVYGKEKHKQDGPLMSGPSFRVGRSVSTFSE